MTIIQDNKTTINRYRKEADQTQWPPLMLINSFKTNVELKNAPDKTPIRMSLSMGDIP